MLSVQPTQVKVIQASKKVGFSASVDVLESDKRDKLVQKEVLNLLQQSTLKGSSGIPEAIELIESAIQKRQFYKTFFCI